MALSAFDMAGAVASEASKLFYCFPLKKLAQKAAWEPKWPSERWETTIRQFPKIKGTILVVPIIRIIV